MKRLLFLTLLALAGCDKPERRPADPELSIPVPEFVLTERNGETIRNADLKGKVWVASFVFTRCTGPCPQVSATVSRLHTDYANQPEIRFVTFTIDPERDKLDDLKKYAENFRAEDSRRWLFLTGPEKTIHELASDGFKMLAKKSPNPKPGEEFDHSSKLAVVDKHGNIRAYFDGIKPDRGNAAMADEQFATSIAVMKLMLERLVKE